MRRNELKKLTYIQPFCIRFFFLYINAYFMRCPSLISDALTYYIVNVCVFPVITVFGGPSILMSCIAFSFSYKCFFGLFIEIYIRRPHSNARQILLTIVLLFLYIFILFISLLSYQIEWTIFTTNILCGSPHTMHAESPPASAIYIYISDQHETESRSYMKKSKFKFFTLCVLKYLHHRPPRF